MRKVELPRTFLKHFEGVINIGQAISNKHKKTCELERERDTYIRNVAARGPYGLYFCQSLYSAYSSGKQA